MQTAKTKDNGQSSHNVIGMDWLKNQMEAYFGTGTTELGLTSSDLSSSVFDMLCSTKSNAELQAEVRGHMYSYY